MRVKEGVGTTHTQKKKRVSDKTMWEFLFLFFFFFEAVFKQ